MSDNSFDCIIIGAGPGGYVAAIRAAQLGFKTAIIDKRKSLGGTCLNIGCIPSKALLDSSELYEVAQNSFKVHGITADNVKVDVPTMVARKNKVVDELTRGVAGLMKKNKIAIFHGAGKITANNQVTVTAEDGSSQVLTAGKSVLIATGSVPVELPFAKADGKNIMTSTEILDLQEVPKHLVIIGGGFIGLELGSVWRRLGAEVTVIEMMAELVPFSDKDVRTAFVKGLTKQGFKFMLSTKLNGIEYAGDKCLISVTPEGGTEQKIEADKVLLSIGRKPFTEGLGLDEMKIEKDERGRVKVDDHFQTNVPGVHAIGDAIAGPMLAHKAEEEGVAWAELLAGKAGHVNYDAIPSVVYTWPEISSVGLTEEQAREKFGDDVKVGKFSFMANGRAKAMNEKEGFVKVISGPNDRLLGCHIYGPRAGDLIAEAVTVMEFNGTAEDIARTCHAHPGLGEAVKEAALAANGRVIHS